LNAWLFGLAAAPSLSAADPVLWYQRPAQPWGDALPVCNGRLGTGVFGRTAKEDIQLEATGVKFRGVLRAMHEGGTHSFPWDCRFPLGGGPPLPAFSAGAPIMGQQVVSDNRFPAVIDDDRQPRLVLHEQPGRSRAL
jgi:hypothetical protein